MSKPRCRFYPEEIARRQCPAIKGAISSRACREKYIVELDCPKDCPHVSENFVYEARRAEKRVRARFKAEFNVLPPWLDREMVVVPVMQIESILARFAQWYPDLTDREALEVLEDYATLMRVEANKLDIEPRFRAGRGLELRTHLERRMAWMLQTDEGTVAPPERWEVLSPVLDRIRESFQRHASNGDRGYLEFLIPFSDRVAPRPKASSRLILP